MTQLHETAYPRLKADPSAQDLDEIYTLTPDEIAFIDKTVKLSSWYDNEWGYSNRLVELTSMVASKL